MYAAVFDLDVAAFDKACTAIRDWIIKHSAVHGLLNRCETEWFSIDESLKEGLMAQLAVSADRSVVAGRLLHWESGDPTRSWRTEFTLERDSDAAWIALRIWFTGLQTDVRDCKPPRFVKELWKAGVLSDGISFADESWLIEDQHDVRLLADLILDEQRDFPVVLLAEESSLNPSRMTRDMIGLAHICVVKSAMRTHLGEILGTEHLLNRGAVRTYYPKVQGREIFAPAARPETITLWQSGGMIGPDAFASWLVRDVSSTLTRRAFNNSAHRSYESVRAAAIDTQRRALAAKAQDIGTLRESLDLAAIEVEFLRRENDDLQKQLQYQNDLEKEYENDNKVMSESVREKTTAIHHLREQIAALRLARRGDGLSLDNISLEEVEAMAATEHGVKTVRQAVEAADRLCKQHGADVIFTDLSFDSAEDSPFKRPDDVLAVLLRLSFLWQKIRASGRRIQEEGRQVLKVPLSLHQSQTSKNQFGDERKVRFEGDDLILEKHIKIGGGGVETALRIYFGDKDGQLLIGHVGKHLTVGNTQ